jgi:hypothetical protein
MILCVLKEAPSTAHTIIIRLRYGCTDAEIATQVGFSERTVRRLVEDVRRQHGT